MALLFLCITNTKSVSALQEQERCMGSCDQPRMRRDPTSSQQGITRFSSHRQWGSVAIVWYLLIGWLVLPMHGVSSLLPSLIFVLYCCCLLLLLLSQAELKRELAKLLKEHDAEVSPL